jgi:hypothetical protein
MHCVVDSIMELIGVVDFVISELNLSDERDQTVSAGDGRSLLLASKATSTTLIQLFDDRMKKNVEG